METMNHYEQEIDLKDLMFAVLRKWRLIVAFGILFALLLGGFKVMKGLQQLNDEEVVQKNREEYETSLEKYETTKERLEKEIENIQSNIESQQDYKDDSILMNINPYDEYVETVTFYVSTDYEIMPGMMYQNPNTASSILKAYVSIAQNGEMYSYVLGRMNNKMGIRYLKELVKIQTDYTNNMMDITVIGDTEKRASDVMRYIKDSIADSHKRITEAIGEHDVNIVDESKYVSVDLDLEKKQKDFTTNMDALDTSLTDKTKELEDLEEPKDNLLTKGSVVKGAVKYAVLGGVLGAFMVVFFVCVVFLMSDKLVSEKELKRRYGVMVLGVFRKADKKRWFGFIDRWLDRMDGQAAAQLEDSQTFEVVAANAMNYVEGVSRILLVGTVAREELERLKEGLAGLLPEKNLTVGGNLGKEAQAIREAASCDAVILVEQRGRSLFGGIEQELEVVRSLEKRVIGCVVL